MITNCRFHGCDTVNRRNIIDKIEKVCIGTNDNDLRRKIGGDFKNLPAYDAKYYLKRKIYLIYISQKSTTKTDESNVHDTKVVNITYVMIKLQFKLPQALINKSGFYPKDSISCPCFSAKRD